MRSQFAEWLDKMQKVADTEDTIIEARHYDMLDFQFKTKLTPEQAFKEYKRFKSRWNVLADNGKNTEAI